MKINHEHKLDFSDVLIEPKRSTLTSRSEVDIRRQFKYPHFNYQQNNIPARVPLIVSNMDHTGTFNMARALDRHDAWVALHKYYSVEDIREFVTQTELTNIFYSMGATNDDFSKLKKMLEINTADRTAIAAINIDVANGYMEVFSDFVARVRELVKDRCVVMAGNVVTPNMVEELILRGADIVKVGVGSGSVCTTRKITGVGYPQLSAVIECADAAHGLNGLICSDGGCVVPGDVAKAFGAGADFVMLGGMFAGHDQCRGQVFTPDGATEKRMKFYGMSSETAMKKYSGGVAEYRAAEGKTVDVPYKGSVDNTVQEILGGVRSACTYVGARKLKDLSKCTTFNLVYRQLNTKWGN